MNFERLYKKGTHMPNNPDYLKNLKMIEKGSSKGAGNNKGPQLMTTLKKLLNKQITRVNPLDKNDLSSLEIAHLLNLTLIAKALEGDTRALAMIYDRIEGKVTQNINVNSDQASIDEIKKQMMENLESENEDEDNGK